MQAIVQERYGSTGVLEARDIEKPTPGEREVLVRVHAASVHLGDWILMTGQPYVMRLMTGLRRPKNAVPGTDLSGTVEAVGPAVRQFKPGDEVFGWATGAFAEYVAADADQFAAKPATLTFEQAAAVGLSATTALQLLRDNGDLRPGQKVLVNGASGGVGTFAVQIAKALGAEVTAVSSANNANLVRSIGADHVVDYEREDFTAGDGRYDLILDNVGNHSMAQTRRALSPTGTLISNGGGHAGGKLGRTLRTMLASKVNRQQAAPSIKTQNRADLLALSELVAAGKLSPVIDSVHPLRRTREAISRVATGRARGTVVITMDEPPAIAAATSMDIATTPSTASTDVAVPAPALARP